VLYYLAVAFTGVAVALTVISGAQFFLGVWNQRHALRGGAQRPS
jgi:CDP-diacylglycerol--glycerol-3-phosphate 3-phosphatidyltransferase